MKIMGRITQEMQLIYLTQSNNSILSPHIAGWTKESNARIAEILLEKITTCAAE